MFWQTHNFIYSLLPLDQHKFTHDDDAGDYDDAYQPKLIDLQNKLLHIIASRLVLEAMYM